EPFQFVDSADVVVLEDQGDALRAEALNLEELQGGGRKLLQQQVAALARTMVHKLADDSGEPLTNAGDIGDLTGGVAEDVGDAFGVPFNSGGAVAVAADAKGIFSGDLHEIG